MIMLLNFSTPWSVLRHAFGSVFSGRIYDESIEHLQYIKEQQACETNPVNN